MAWLVSVLEGNVKRSVQSIETSGIFYKAAFKTWRRDFGAIFLILHLRLKNLFDQSQIKGSDRTMSHQYHHQLNAWLISVRYETPILPNKNLTKAVTRLPHFLWQDFFKYTRDIDLTDGTSNLIGFEKWLEKKTRILFKAHVKIIVKRGFWEKTLLKVNIKISKDIQPVLFIKMASVLQITNYHLTKVQLTKT